MSEANKSLVRRLIEETINKGDKPLVVYEKEEKLA